MSADPMNAAAETENRIRLKELLGNGDERSIKVYPLSFAQQRLWILNELDPGGITYNIALPLVLKGVVAVRAVGVALDQLLERHAALRTTFTNAHGRPLQLVRAWEPFELVVTDLSALPRGAPGARTPGTGGEPGQRALRVRALATAYSRRPFDLRHGPVFRAHLVRVEREQHVLFLAMHHIASDGWSMGILLREFAALYAAALAGQASELPPLEVQYGDYADWERRELAGERLASRVSFWREELRGMATIELPVDRPRSEMRSERGANRWVTLPAGLIDPLTRLSRDEGATLFMTLLAAFQVLLHRHTRQNDIVVGTPVANRDQRQIEEVVGFFVNMVVIRGDVSGDPTFRQLVRRVRESCLAAYAHQDIPFEKLASELIHERDPGRHPLFQVVFALQNATGAAMSEVAFAPRLIMPGLDVSDMPLGSATAKFDLSLDVVLVESGLLANLEYSTDLFDEDSIVRLLRRFEVLLEGIAQDPGTRVSELPLLPESERDALLGPMRPVVSGQRPEPAVACLHALFAEQARRTPDAVAVVYGEETLTYGALAKRASRLARRLRALGAGPDGFVALFLGADLDLVVGILAVLAADAAYVPIDPEHPAERVAFLLKDSGAPIVVTDAALASRLPRTGARVLLVDDDTGDDSRESSAEHRIRASSDNLAYLIYTSGSTGSPKGVTVTHGNVIRLFSAAAEHIRFDSKDVWTLFHSCAFDFSVWELWGALLSGGRLVVLPREVVRAPSEFHRLIARERVTIVSQTPSAFRQLVQFSPERPRTLALRYVIFGGEALDPRSLRAWLDRYGEDTPRLVNMYGITETTVHVTQRAIVRRDIDEPQLGSPIGRPLSDLRCVLLDQACGLVPLGAVGEIYVGGAGVARGYHARPALTAERFVPDPFGAFPGARLYRSGDLARQRPDGELYVLGRADSQVQVRGFRVELGEIEATLRAHRDVHDAVLSARAGSEGVPRLAAYVVARAAQRPSVSELRRHLARTLPDYMLPASIDFLDAVPLTANGKVDHAALPEPESSRPDLAEEYVGPEIAVHARLAGIWREVLEIDQVGIHDNFFDLGGDSLLLVRVHSRVEKAFGCELAVAELFRSPTIAALAEQLPGGRRRYAQTTTPPEAAVEPVRLDARHRGDAELETPIAVIGMSGRFPGASNVEKFWRDLCDGVEGISHFTREELEEAGMGAAFLDHPGAVKSRGHLEGVELFDAAHFGYSPRDAALIDPQQRIFLECAWEALEDAGHDPRRFNGDIAVFAGAGVCLYMITALGRPDMTEASGLFQLLISNDKDFLATRVAYKLGLGGPAVGVQTACSSSLVAAHLAVQSLQRMESDMALAGGVSINAFGKSGYLHQPGGIASPDGHCRAFDARAAGTVGSSGAGVVLLKRLSDARRDRDHIYAVLRGSAVNNDGSLKVGYSAPSVERQAAVIAAAQRRAGVSPDSITYVEAHGTGTKLGDPVEIAALNQVFRGRTTRKRFCAIGSVKSNIGHLDTAAGVAGLIKTSLALHHGVIPASLHYESANPEIDFDGSPFYVNARTAEWKRGATPRRAGVSAFGIGGTNAHAVLEEAPPVARDASARSWQALPLCARTAAALEQVAANLATHLRRNPEVELRDVAFTLEVGRAEFAHRRVVVCRDVEGAVRALEGGEPRRVLDAVVERDGRSVVFLFPGQGSQHTGMGSVLYREEPIFRQNVDRCLELCPSPLADDLRRVFAGENTAETAALLRETHHAQPALFTLEFALAQLWISRGVRPRAMMGHSVGEYVAACLAGVVTLADGIELINARGRLMGDLPRGAMLAVHLSVERLHAFLDERLAISGCNTPDLCTVSGPVDAVARLERELSAAGHTCQPLHTSHAFHSAMMDPILPRFREVASGVAFRSPSIPYVSNLTGAWASGDEVTRASYWADHLRGTVRFAEGLGTLFEDPHAVLLEVGPGQALSTFARAHPRRPKGVTVLASMPHPRSDTPEASHLAETVGRLWLAGVRPDWTALHAVEESRRIALPTYPFQRSRHWLDAPAAAPAERCSAPKESGVPGDWLYLPLWKETLLPAGAPARTAEISCCVLLADSRGSELQRALTGHARHLVVVMPGDSFALLGEADGESSFQVAPGEDDDYVRLLSALEAQGRTPAVVIHAWDGRTEDARDPTGRDRSLHSVLCFVRAHVVARPGAPLRMLVVRTSTQAVTGAEDPWPEGVLAFGPCMVVSQEYPNIQCSFVDVEDGCGAASVVRELAAEPVDRLVAYRAGRRWVPRFERVPSVGHRAAPDLLRTGGTYLITGGLGKVGLTLALDLARGRRVKLALIGRTLLPERSRWEELLSTGATASESQERIRKLLAIESLGAEVLVLRADVADESELRLAVEETEARFGAIHGVFHAAGLAGDAAFRTVSETRRADFEAQLAPKVGGTLALARIFQGRAPDFVMVMSSLATVLGGIGFTAYAAANLYLDALVQRERRGSRIRWTSVNWDAWNFTGADATALDRSALTPAEGVAALHAILELGCPGRIVVAAASLESRFARWMQGATPPALRITAADGAGPAAPRPELTSKYVAPRSSVERALAGIWQELLGLEAIGIHDDFLELGGHSLLAIQVISRAREVFRLEVPIRTLFDSPTIAGMAEVVAKAQAQALSTAQRAFVLPQPRGGAVPGTLAEDYSDEEVDAILRELTHGDEPGR